MMKWLWLENGLVAASRIVAVGGAETAAMRRLLAATPPEKVVGLTGGQRRQTVLVLDSDHVVLCSLTLGELTRELRLLGEVVDETE